MIRKIRKNLAAHAHRVCGYASGKAVLPKPFSKRFRIKKRRTVLTASCVFCIAPLNNIRYLKSAVIISIGRPPSGDKLLHAVLSKVSYITLRIKSGCNENPSHPLKLTVKQGSLRCCRVDFFAAYCFSPDGEKPHDFFTIHYYLSLSKAFPDRLSEK